MVPISGLGNPSNMNIDEPSFTNNIQNANKSDTTSSLPPQGKGKDSSSLGLTPDAPNAAPNPEALSSFVATLSPGAALAAICVKEAAQLNELHQKDLLDKGEAIQKEMAEQAENIKNGALKQMIFSIAGSVTSIATSVVSAYKISKIDTGLSQEAFAQAKVYPEALSSVGRSVDGTLNSIGGYLQAREQADNKKLDAAIENNRTMMESLRNTMQAQRDLVSKSLEFMNSMQSNMNQTHSRILG